MTRGFFRVASRIIAEHSGKRGELITHNTVLDECSITLEPPRNRCLLFQGNSAMQGPEKMGRGQCEDKRGRLRQCESARSRSVQVLRPTKKGRNGAVKPQLG